MRPALFEGPVEAGRDYILVDDTLASGATMASMRAYVESHGGRVVAVTTLASAPPGHGTLDPRQVAVTPQTLGVRLRFRGYCEGWLSQGRDGGSIDPCERRAMDREHLMQRMRERADVARSEEHTSELQSLMRISYAVFCLQKKKTHNNIQHG